MSASVGRRPKMLSKTEFFAIAEELPGQTEFVDGVIGAFSDAAKLTLLANWGADEIIRLTGPEIWRAALAPMNDASNDQDQAK